jgi:hypothetical protein
MRRYELDPNLVDEFLTFFTKLIPVRSKFGFRLLSAYLDRADSEFTWIVEHDDAFVDAEAVYMASPERAAMFAGQPQHALVLHVSNVEPIAPVKEL